MEFIKVSNVGLELKLFEMILASIKMVAWFHKIKLSSDVRIQLGWVITWIHNIVWPKWANEKKKRVRGFASLLQKPCPYLFHAYKFCAYFITRNDHFQSTFELSGRCSCHCNPFSICVCIIHTDSICTKWWLLFHRLHRWCHRWRSSQSWAHSHTHACIWCIKKQKPSSKNDIETTDEKTTKYNLILAFTTHTYTNAHELALLLFTEKE